MGTSHMATGQPATSAPIQECSICLQKMLLKDVTTLKCGHQFHKACLNKWVRTKSIARCRASCPLCRVPITGPQVRRKVSQRAPREAPPRTRRRQNTTVPRPHRQHEARVALRMHTEHRFVDTERGQWGRNDSNNSSGLISYQYDTNAWYNANAFDQALHNLHNSVSSSAITRQSQRAEHQERQRHLQAEREAQEAEMRRAAETVVRAQRRAAMQV